MAKRPQFTKEFKLEAVRLWKSSGKPAAVIARELGLRRNHLYRWQLELEKHGDAALPGRGAVPTVRMNSRGYGERMRASARSGTFLKKPR
jgi:transposase-like protein